MRLPPVWKVLVPVAALAAGALFATSARTAAGTDLRAPATADLAGTVRDATSTVARLQAQVAALTAEVDAATARVGQGDAAVADLQRRVDALRAAAGSTALRGPGLTVTLDDAPPDAADRFPANDQADLDELVIHQSDLQAVVNAVWAGGAEAVSVAGQRLVPTSAVRCVGNTLLLNGQVYSPPYAVVAIGPAAAMRAALDRSRGVSLLRQAADYYGVGYSVASSGQVSVPGFAGQFDLSSASPG